MSDSNLDKRSVIKGRGAVINASGRFEDHCRETFDDGWDSPVDGKLQGRHHIDDLHLHPAPTRKMTTPEVR